MAARRLAPSSFPGGRQAEAVELRARAELVGPPVDCFRLVTYNVGDPLVVLPSRAVRDGAGEAGCEVAERRRN